MDPFDHTLLLEGRTLKYPLGTVLCQLYSPAALGGKGGECPFGAHVEVRWQMSAHFLSVPGIAWGQGGGSILSFLSNSKVSWVILARETMFCFVLSPGEKSF